MRRVHCVEDTGRAVGDSVQGGARSFVIRMIDRTSTHRQSGQAQLVAFRGPMPDADARPATTRPARTASFFPPVPTLVDTPAPAPSRPSTPRRAVKRAVDVAVSSLFLLVLLPVVALVALAVKLESRGPVFYGALRVGRTGETFRMLKFRKMHHGATGMRLTTDDDQRLTRVGSWLTKTKLDELPQFWNVLVGDMSLIGPRPEDPYFVELRKEEFEDILVRPPRRDRLLADRVRRGEPDPRRQRPAQPLPRPHPPAEARARPDVRVDLPAAVRLLDLLLDGRGGARAPSGRRPPADRRDEPAPPSRRLAPGAHAGAHARRSRSGSGRGAGARRRHGHAPGGRSAARPPSSQRASPPPRTARTGWKWTVHPPSKRIARRLRLVRAPVGHSRYAYR